MSEWSPDPASLPRSHDERDPGESPSWPSRYREFEPARPLAGRLVCTWTQVIGDVPGDYPQRVLPDGCVDLVWVGSEAPVAVGPATRLMIARLPPRTAVVGVRFRPGLAPAGLGAPASELVDREVELRELWGDAADALAERVGPRSPVAARIAALEEALMKRGDRLDPDPVAAAAVSWLARDPGARVDRIARRLGMSARQLHRRFTAAVGYGPKTFQRIARFQRLLELARRPHRAEGLSQLALDAGYADQAHMTREVGALSERTPSALLGQVPSTLAMAELFDGEAAPLAAPFTDTTPRRP